MSGICGAISFDGRPQALDLSPLLLALRSRGPDRTGAWQGRRAALGHCLLATTSEAAVEQLPLENHRRKIVITADARLDNREDLLRALAIPSAGRTIGDGELIGEAYAKWGDECVTQLIGDFAFAIWDEDRSRLLCARDPMGMRQLLYAPLPGAALVFATEARAILRHELLKPRLNDARIADYLANLEGADLESTFFKGVLRLPPGHVLSVDPTGLKVGAFWKFGPVEELSLRSDADYAEAFLTHFEEAVRCRLRSAGSVGATLSGGLDSASVVAIAAPLATGDAGPLRTFSAVGPNADECPETRSVTTLLEVLDGIAPVTVSWASLESYFQALGSLTAGSLEPFDGHMTLLRAVYLDAHRAGVRVVLDGVGADVVLASDRTLASLLRRGRIGLALREARGEQRVWGDGLPVWRSLSKALWQAFAPGFVRRLKQETLDVLRDRRHIDAGIAGSAFALRLDLAGRRQAARNRAVGAEGEFEASWLDANLIVARERYDRVAAQLQIEPRDPFCDVRLVHFCRSLPLLQRQRNGMTKFILRRAMRGRLPDAVAWRRGKEHLGWAFTGALLGAGEGGQREPNPPELIHRYVDWDRALECRNSEAGFADWLSSLYLTNWFETVPDSAA